MQGFEVASLMICAKPRIFAGRFILSASDAVWEPVQFLPDELINYLTDDLGNPSPKYAGYLQVSDSKILDDLDDRDLFACFRMVESYLLAYVDAVPPRDLYDRLSMGLAFVGWDVCSGNGWLSASSHGIFPIDPFDGRNLGPDSNEINEFGLFQSLSHAQNCCEENGLAIAEHAPWYPVGILLTARSRDRLLSGL